MKLKILVLVLALLALALPAAAQTKVASTEAVKVDWPAPTASADGLDVVEGFRIKAIATATGNAVLKTWTAPATARTLTVSDIPATGVFTFSVFPYNSEGEGGPSVSATPFGRARTPLTLGAGATASVVPRP